MRNKTWPLLLTLAATGMAREVYQEPADFVNETFHGSRSAVRVLWITPEMRRGIQAILGEDPRVLRLRYWQGDERRVWILEAVGKERPITAGVVVSRDRIERLKVLIYRESRGWEVRYPFFTDQFRGAELRDGLELDRTIDNISGATLSVRALKRIARLALYLTRQTERSDGPA